jgi:hypothetical protein
MSFTREPELPVEPARKKLKTSDLPLSSATRSAIESLAHTFKKKGGYDALRKQVWEKFADSVTCPALPINDFYANSTLSTLGLRSTIQEVNP